MTILITAIVAECMVWFTVFEIIDPCDTTTRLRFMPYRSSQIPLTPDPDQFSICDQRLDYREGWWYLPADESDNLYDITTQCPGLLTCSSMYPIYYNGSIPRVEDGVVETRACQLGNDGCAACTVVGIKIKNCGRYRVYFLPRASGCLHAYCFEPTNSTLISTTDKTTSVASTVTTRTTPKETTEPEPDPCDTTTPLPNLAYRSPQHDLTPDPDQFSICDQRLDYREGWWYLPVDKSNNLYDITTKCPGLLTCSSMYPIYYNGSIPRVEDGVVQTWACQLGNEGCSACTGVRIKIKNCGSYRVYFLPRASGCSHAYCFELLNTSPATTITTAKTTEKGAKPDTTTIPPDTGKQLSTAVLAAIVASSFLFFAGAVILCVLFVCRWRKQEDPPMFEEAVKDPPTNIYDVITNTTNVKYGPLGVDNMGYETNGSLSIYDEIPGKTDYLHPLDKPHNVQNEGVGNPGYLHAILANNASDGSRNVPPKQFVNMESSVERQSSEYDEAFINENALNEERLHKEETTA